MHSLLDAGAKSVSHLERLLDKFNWLVAAAAQDGPARARVVGAVAAYWRAPCHTRAMPPFAAGLLERRARPSCEHRRTSPHMTWLVLSKLVRRADSPAAGVPSSPATPSRVPSPTQARARRPAGAGWLALLRA